MRSRHTLCVLATLVLSACSQKSEPSHGEKIHYQVAPAADAAAAPAAEAARAPPLSGAPPSVVAAGAPMMAYAYSYRLRLPPRRVDELRRRHETACVKAGYRVCQVVSTFVTGQGEDEVQGQLILRAAPTWLRGVRDGLEGEAKDLGGKVTSSEVTSEDLSREIVDTTAQLRAKTTLRDRLQALLASRPGKVGDLLEVERELARVQGEIDSTQSQLAVMQARVATSELTLRYESQAVLGRASAWSPLADAFTDFLAISAASLAGLVRLLAWLAPWALIGGGLLWVFRKRLPKLRWPFRRKAPPAA